MLFRRGHSLPRPPARFSFAGRSVVERMRSTAFALLGVTTAMALGLVALVSHQSWPYLPAAPIIDYGAKSGDLDNAVPLVSLPPGRRGARIAGEISTGERGGSGSGGRRGGSSPAGSRHPSSQSDPGTAPGGLGVAAPPPSPAPPPAPAPTVSPPPVPASQPTQAPSPPPAPGGAPAQPATPAAVASSSPGKGHAYGKQKAPAAPVSKPSRSAPSPPPASASAPAEKAPPAPVPTAEDSPGNGRGHAYGHSK